MSTLGNGAHTPYPGADGTLEGALAEVDALLARFVAEAMVDAMLQTLDHDTDVAIVSPATLLRTLEAWLDAADVQRTAEDGVA